MTRAYVALGSNVDPEANVRAAVRLLAARERVLAASTFYWTEAIPPGNPEFINGALALETRRRPLDLKLDVLRDIEARLGRIRTADRNAPRPIDCDLLAYGDEVASEPVGEGPHQTTRPGLALPSPDIEKRAFVAIPLLEIAPDLILARSGRRLADVVASLPPHPMVPAVELTGEVRRELEVKDGPSTHRGARPAAPR
jgi:dihydroneopterin aldolase/2-amino-4-hydroxy-6-hydroxymethyldihydropteridine diphosphokinase